MQRKHELKINLTPVNCEDVSTGSDVAIAGAAHNKLISS